MASYPKHINHERSQMACPVELADVDLFGAGAQEHWYEAYEILHREAPVLRLTGGGITPGTDAFVLTKHADVARVVKEPERFPALTQTRVGGWAAEGMTAEDTFAKFRSLMQASMVSLRPTQELYIRHRKELTDPWVGTGAMRHREMITKHANDLLDEWIADGEVEFISRFARPLPQRASTNPKARSPVTREAPSTCSNHRRSQSTWSKRSARAHASSVWMHPMPWALKALTLMAKRMRAARIAHGSSSSGRSRSAASKAR